SRRALVHRVRIPSHDDRGRAPDRPRARRAQAGQKADPRLTMRILHCIPTLEGGGAERQLALLGPKHVAAGHEIHVALLRGGPHLDAISRGCVTVHQLPRRSPHDPRTALSIASLIGDVQPDIVQTWLLMMDVWGGFA